MPWLSGLWKQLLPALPAIGLAALVFFAGFTARGIFNDAGLAKDAVKTGMTHSLAQVTMLQNAGRREMNMLWRAEAERGQCVATIEALEDMHFQSAEAQRAALSRADSLKSQLSAVSAEYEKLVESYEDADQTTTDWLNGRLPDGVRCLRYDDAGCSVDHFTAAGYPAPPDREPALEDAAGGRGSAGP